MARKYPYSQIVQLMYGLRLRTSSEHLFNQQLGKTAALTNNRAVLFELFENKAPTLNAGIETVEVEQSLPSPVLPQVAAVEPAQEERVVEPEAVKPEEPATAMEAPAPVEEKPVQSPPPSPVEAKKEEKVDLPSATPENMEGLSPQERVQAILRRNRELRAQFDAQKSGEGEKLWESQEEVQASSPTVESSLEEEVQESPLESAISDDLQSESLTNEQDQKEKAELSQETPTEESEVVDPDAILAKIQNAEWTEEAPANQEITSESEDQAEEEKEPWADSPIDIEALIRRRFSRRYEPLPEEEDLWAEEEESTTEEVEVGDDGSASSSEETIQESATEEKLDQDAPTEVSEEESTEQSVELKSDLALASRIRAIRERMEGLKDNEAISREELEILMEEHRQLEALMADLPLDEDQLFEVEVSEAGDIDEEPFEVEAPLEPEQTKPAPTEDEASEEEDALALAEQVKDEIEQEETGSQIEDSLEERDENKGADLVTDDEAGLEADNEVGLETDETSLEKHEASPEKHEAGKTSAEEEFLEEDSKDEAGDVIMPIVHLNVENRKEEAKVSEEEESKELEEDEPKVAKKERSSDVTEEKKQGPSESNNTVTTEQEASSNSSEATATETQEKPVEESKPPKAESGTAAPEAKEEEDLDAEIRRIEALAAQLKSGRNRDMSRDERHSMREERMNEMIEDRKRSLEEHAAQQEAEEESESADEPIPTEGAAEDESISGDQASTVAKEETSLEKDEAGLDTKDEASKLDQKEEAPNLSTSSVEEGEEENTVSEIALKSEEVFEVEIGANDDTEGEVEEMEALDTSSEQSEESIQSEDSTQEEPEDDAQDQEPALPINEDQNKLSSTADSNEEEENPEVAAPAIVEEVRVEEAQSEGPSFSDWLKQVAQGSTASDESLETSNLKEENTETEERSENPETESKEGISARIEAAEDESDPSEKVEDTAEESEISKKIDLLDSFVEKLPELKKQSREGASSPRQEVQDLGSDERQGAGLVTETLAKVYIRQKHYKKAIQAYEILMLKYPEKSTFFADQISEIKKLSNSKS